VLETKDENQKQKPRKMGKGCLGWFWRLSVVGLMMLAGLLVWLNGPGMRWLGPRVAAHFIEKAGLEGGLRLGGTMLGGIKVYDLDLKSEEAALERLVVERLEMDYRFLEVIKGKVRGISGEGIHVELRLVEKEKPVDEPPLDFAAIGKTLNALRAKVIPMDLDLKKVSVAVRKDGARVVELEDSNFFHKSGGGVIELALGRITDAEGRFTQQQNTSLAWEEGKLTLDMLDLLPVLGVRDLGVMLPENGEISALGMIRLEGAMLRLEIGRGIRDVRLNLTEGEIDFGKVLGGFGMEFPIKGRLTSLAVDVKQVFPKWQAAVGTAEVFVEGFSCDGWDVAELSAGVTLDDGGFSARLAGKAFGSDMAVNGGGDFEREKLGTGDFILRRISGDLRIAKVGEVLRALDAKLDMQTEFREFPESEIGGTWAVDFGERGFEGVEGDLMLNAKVADAASLRLDARYDKGTNGVTVKALEAAGMEFSGSYGIASQEYEAKQVLTGFDSAGIVPWLRGAGLATPGSSVVSMKWEASGNIADGTMRGEVTALEAMWKWNAPQEGDARPPISTKAERITYDWPWAAEVAGLVVETEGQTVKLDAKLANNELQLENLLWLEGEEELAKGAGKLPMPENFANWKEFLENDTRPLNLSLKSATLPLAKLKPWVKGLDKIGAKATGKLDIEVGGSLAMPEVDASLELRGISVPDRPELPETDVTLKMDAGGGIAKVTGEAVAPGYAPATLEAQMPFLPKKWAEDPESIKVAPLSGTLELPRVDLSRFEALIPGAEELKGIAEGKIVVKGTVGNPEVSGDLKLTGGKLGFVNDAIPGLDGMDLDLQTNLEEVTLKGGIKRVEGGDLDLNGSMAIRETGSRKAGDMDVSVKARGLPVVRNDFLIVRANADLRVRGGMTDALVTGEIGIVDSMFYKDMELIPIGKPFLEPKAAKLPGVSAKAEVRSIVPAAFGGWTANVVVKTIDPILIRGNLGKGEVDVALRVEGKLADPKPNGTVRLRDAVARLPFSTLDVKQGTLTFSPATGLDPVVELRGTAEPRPYRVEVFAYGRMSDPQLLLTSQPPLPENEIMTLLATGTTSSGLEDSQAASSRALQLLIEELRRGRFLFGKQFRPILGLLDEVDFSLSEGDPYDSGTYNSAQLKLGEKWYLSAGVGSTGDQRVMVIYRLRFK